ncbi:DUF6085 family protein [Streptomyces sp. YKOK-I1]
MTEPTLPRSTAPAAAAHPLVQGRCPACGGSSLFLGSGGYITCSRLDCPQPDAATEVIADFWEARQHGAFTFCSQSVGHVTMAAFARKISEKRAALAQRESAVRYANEQKQRADRAEAGLNRVRAYADRLDTTGNGTDIEADSLRRAAATGIRNAVADSAPAAAQATELETTARVLAALHRSAEEEVSRVIALYERWVKAGAPPLGTSVARWWDKRLVELHDAILPPDPSAPTATEATSRPT